MSLRAELQPRQRIDAHRIDGQPGHVAVDQRPRMGGQLPAHPLAQPGQIAATDRPANSE